MKLVVDTNVWLDYYLPERAGFKEAKRFLLSAVAHDHALFFTVGSMKDTFYLLGNLTKMSMRATGPISGTQALAANEFAWGCINNMRRLGTPIGMDVFDADLALKFRAVHPDFEDNLLCAVAQRVQADYLVTNDRALTRIPFVATATPREARLLCEL